MISDMRIAVLHEQKEKKESEIPEEGGGEYLRVKTLQCVPKVCDVDIFRVSLQETITLARKISSDNKATRPNAERTSIPLQGLTTCLNLTGKSTRTIGRLAKNNNRENGKASAAVPESESCAHETQRPK